MDADADKILDIEELSRYLHIPVSTIYKLIREGRVPGVKIGKHWRFLKKNVDEMFDTRKPV